MNENGKTLEYSECDFESKDRLLEINVDQRLLDTWHRLAEVENYAPSFDSLNLYQGGSFRYLLGSGRQRILPGLNFGE